jgi:hypothetical protein
MLPSLNFSKKDPKFTLLNKVFKYVDNKNAMRIYGRNGVKNIFMMVISIKILFMSFYFDYPISKLIDEINRDNRLRKFLNIRGEVPEASQFYEYISRYSSEKFVNIVNSLLKTCNKNNKNPYKKYIVDGSPIECDINHIKQYISPEKLKELKLKWGYSTTKGNFIGFKITVVLDEQTLCPVSILIHSGAPHDSKLFDEILKELKRRRIIKPKNILLFDKGYYSYNNYNIGINQYKVICIIFPKSTFDINKLEEKLSYPLDVFKKKKQINEKKALYQNLKSLLLKKIENWKEFKPIRGKIEDFFKVTKQAFGLDKLHKYTTESITKHVFLAILLTTIVIQQGYMTKTAMQQLAEGNIELKPPKKRKKNQKKNKTKTEYKTKVPKESQQQLPIHNTKEPQTTLQLFQKI